MRKKLGLTALFISVMLLSTGCMPIFGKGSDDSNESVAPGGTVVLNAKDVKNVILFIGDGMGPEQVKFGEIMKERKLSFQEFPYSTSVDTNSLD